MSRLAVLIDNQRMRKALKMGAKLVGGDKNGKRVKGCQVWNEQGGWNEEKYHGLHSRRAK